MAVRAPEDQNGALLARTDEESAVTAFSNRWAILAVLILGRTAFGLQYQSVGAVGPAMMADLRLTFTDLGTLLGAYSTLGMFLAIPAGWLIGRFGDRRVMLTGLALMVAGGALLTLAPGFAMALAGRSAAGAGSLLIGVVGPKMVMDRFAGSALPAAMGALLASYPLGIGLGLMVLPHFGSWRVAMAASTAFCAAGLAAGFFTPGATPIDRRVAPPHRLGTGTLIPLMAVALIWTFLNAGYAVLLGFGAAFFVHGGMAAAQAGLLTSVGAFMAVPVLPVGGFVSGRIGRPLTSIGVCLCVMAFGLLGVAAGLPALPMLLSIAISLGLCAGPIMALPGEFLTPEHRALGMGLLFAVYYAGMTLLPPLAGLAGDATASAAAPIVVGAAFLALGALCVPAYARLRQPV